MADTKIQFDALAPDEQDTVLRIGMMMFDHGRRGLTDAAVATEREAAEEKMREIREEAFVAKNALQKELENTRTRAADRERELRERFREEVGDRATQLAEEREAVLQRELTRVREDAARERERLTAEHVAAMDRLREVTDRLMGVSENSSKRGRAGEVVASEEVRRVFKDATEIEDKASEGKSGDIHVILPDIGKIILDIKHHAKGSGGVRKKDRDKLLRDIDDDKNDAVGGILVATQASIQGMSPCSVLYSPKYHRPMVACELRGDWDRLKDSREVISTIITIQQTPYTESTKNVREYDTTESLRNVLKGLRNHREELRNRTIDITKLMGDICVTLDTITHKGDNVHTENDIEEWLLSKYEVTRENIHSGGISVRDITSAKDAPSYVTKRSMPSTIRDMLVRAGARFQKGGQKMLNVKHRTHSQHLGSAISNE